MNEREKQIEIFNDTLKQINTHPVLQETVSYNKTHTKVWMENENILRMDIPKSKSAKITVINQRTLKAAEKLPNVAVLNFASATNPGGGVVRGSIAQEECLCRCSTLYPVISDSKFYDEFYQYHRNKHNTLYTDRMLYTENVKVFKSDTPFPKLLDEKDWYDVDIITSAAPNIREISNINQNELLNIFKSRISRIFALAVHYKKDNIVVGAFGCGAFRNPPALVARAFREVLQDYKKYFDNIVFAVLVTSGNKGNENYEIFKRNIH